MDYRAERYIAAIDEIRRRGLSAEHLSMLRAHWAAPRRTVSMAQLARSAGYPEGYYANIQYGSLARRIARYAGIRVDQNRIALNAIATWSDDSFDPRGHFAFTMRAGLATALQRCELTIDAVPPEESNDATEFVEGEVWEAMVHHRSREQRLRAAKVAEALRASKDGRLRCQVPRCGFDFETVYGSTGAGYAHVHHLRPLSTRSAPEKTRLADLVVVCANCHAMIHRFGASRPLRGLVQRRRPV